MKTLYNCLYDFDCICLLYRLKYFIIRDTLLNAIEICDLQKEQDVADLCMTKTALSKLKEIKLEKYGYVLHRKRFYMINNDKIYIKIHVDCNKKDDINPLKRIPINSFLVYAPKDPIKYLLDEYEHKNGKLKIKEKMSTNIEIKRNAKIPRFLPQKKGTSYLNRYFDNVFVINLHDQTDRLKKMEKRLENKGISYTLYNAIDGRCKYIGEDEIAKALNKVACKRKRIALERNFGVELYKKLEMPALSLTLGSIDIFKYQVKNKLERIVIFEDDAVFSKNFENRLKDGLKEIQENKINWDLLYLGCGGCCGNKVLSETKKSRTKNLTTLNKFMDDVDFYVGHKWDLRLFCDNQNQGKEIIERSRNISTGGSPGATFAYCISLKGAKKILKYIDNFANDHIDQILRKAMVFSNLKTGAFDPPICYHYGGADRADSTLEWKWE